MGYFLFCPHGWKLLKCAHTSLAIKVMGLVYGHLVSSRSAILLP
jgi:hypothetical protein